jgi:hypothetical protein
VEGDAEPLMLLLLFLLLLLLFFVLVGTAAIVEAARGQRFRQWDGNGARAWSEAGRRGDVRRSDSRQRNLMCECSVVNSFLPENYARNEVGKISNKKSTLYR